VEPLQLILTAVLAPALAAGLVLAIGWKLWRPESADGRALGAPALALAFLLGSWFLSGWPESFWPGSKRTPTGLDWLVVLTVLGALCLPFEARLGRWRFLLRGVFVTLVIRLVLRNAFASTWQPVEGWLWFGGLATLYLVLWAAIERLTTQRPGASGPLILWTLASALAGLAALTGSVRIAQLTAGLAAGLGAAVVISWRWPRFNLGGGGGALALLLLFGLGLNAYFFSYTSATDIVLLATAPLWALLASLPRWRAKPDWQRTAIAVGLVLIPLCIALARAGQAFLEAADEYSY
jgi:hypothetical protein